MKKFNDSKESSDKILNQENGTNDRPEVYGCTDPKADNFNSSATIDDGSCTYLANPGNNG